MFMTGTRSRHQQRCVHAGHPGGTQQISSFHFISFYCKIIGQGIISEVCNIATGYMHMKVFSEVYCDMVYFLCAERFETGSGFDPPPPQWHPLPSWNLSTPPPPPRVHDHVAARCHYSNLQRAWGRTWRVSQTTLYSRACQHASCSLWGREAKELAWKSSLF